jgi:uncharacterized membrane-anchored protein YitT (DUF2179 family)
MVGCLLVALAVCLFSEAGLFTGGTTGVAFLIHYVWGWPLAGVPAMYKWPWPASFCWLL